MDKKRLEAIRGLNPMPENERYKYNITSLQVGGYFTFRGQNWLVTNISRYLDVRWNNFARRKKDWWTVELTIFSLKTGETKYIEYSVDGDDIEIYFTEKEVKLREITYNGAPLTRNDLEYIAEEEEGELRFSGKSYYYSDDETAAALYFRNYMNGDEDHRDSEKVRFYEFESDNGTCLTVEVWLEDPADDRPEREAFISVEVLLSDIKILQLANN